MSSNLHAKKSHNESDLTYRHSNKDLFLKDDNILVKGENISEFCQLSIEEIKAWIYRDKMREEQHIEVRNRYFNNRISEQQQITQRKEHFDLKMANNDDLSQEITEFKEDISNIREIFRNRSHSLQKPKNTFKELFKKFEQEQLIIDYSLAEECKKHNIDPQMVKLIPITQDLEYGRSSRIFISRNLPSLSGYSNQY
jgi:predicted nuclease with TOPRIM domain